MADEIILWTCPVCGKVEPGTGQSSRYCGATNECSTKRGDFFELTAMEKIAYITASGNSLADTTPWT